jgi:outer membrane biosynthesis protein TonB
LTISFVFHGVLVAVLIYFAAREGYIGKKLQKIAVEMVKVKPPEKPKEAPKPEPPKVEVPKIVQAPPKEVEAPKAAPSTAPPVVAPPPAELGSFEFGGGKAVNSESDPVQLYKGYMEYELRNSWNKPDNMADDSYVAEVQVHVDRQGNLSDPVWQKGSGNAQWDATVKDVFKVVTAIDRPPPTNFPPEVTIRFDVDNETEPVLQ